MNDPHIRYKSVNDKYNCSNGLNKHGSLGGQIEQGGDDFVQIQLNENL